MKHQPLVTIITATFNLCRNGREETFRQCVESVHHQTYPNIEHLVIDGASDDGSLELIKEFAEKGWIKCLSEADKSLYDAMNKGLQMAKGKYVNILNSDDYFCDREAVRLSVEALEKNGADVSYAPYYYIDSAGQKHLTQPEDVLSDYKMPSSHQTMFARTRKIIEAGRYDLRYKICADFNNYLKMLGMGAKRVKIEQPIVCFRNGGISSDQKKTKKEAVDILYNIYHEANHLTRQDCEDICNDKLTKNLLRKLNKPELFEYVRAQRRKKIYKTIRHLPRLLLDIKWNRKRRYLRILGICLINKQDKTA